MCVLLLCSVLRRPRPEDAHDGVRAVLGEALLARRVDEVPVEEGRVGRVRHVEVVDGHPFQVGVRPRRGHPGRDLAGPVVLGDGPAAAQVEGQLRRVVDDQAPIDARALEALHELVAVLDVEPPRRRQHDARPRPQDRLGEPLDERRFDGVARPARVRVEHAVNIQEDDLARARDVVPRVRPEAAQFRERREPRRPRALLVRVREGPPSYLRRERARDVARRPRDGRERALRPPLPPGEDGVPAAAVVVHREVEHAPDRASPRLPLRV
ncbi:unnamed protein product [Pelagomonas calceolata]|uniref:Uncharacterized protein n=1 Tax=Pelagomonas calceolata TaxID=35677 RepID=A0A8J2SHU7_9STRA|nr:unnamed protein product [Pelagomonas calceolata]|mmetsp:Transcript_11762/g.34748  ORF Transcript_11762/g.34748 Transcript_11762/m.34748 type:complete len:268 (-) Transcript_11762:142-945(-)